jgi:hypothetical protein
MNPGTIGNLAPSYGSPTDDNDDHDDDNNRHYSITIVF